MFNVDLKDVKQFTDNAKACDKAAKLTVKRTLNKLAFETSNTAKTKTLPETFTLRNRYIASTVRYESVRGTGDIDSMASFAGQMSSFKGKKTNQLEHQELGKPVVAKGKYTKAATAFSRSGNYKKRIAKSRRFATLKGKKGIVTIKDIAMHPSKYELSQAVKIAKKRNEEYNLVSETKKGVKGIFRVTKNSVKLLYRFTDKSNKIKRREWLRPTSERVMKNVDKYYAAEAHRTLEKTFGRGLRRTN